MLVCPSPPQLIPKVYSSGILGTDVTGQRPRQKCGTEAKASCVAPARQGMQAIASRYKNQHSPAPQDGQPRRPCTRKHAPRLDHQASASRCRATAPMPRPRSPGQPICASSCTSQNSAASPGSRPRPQSTQAPKNNEAP